MYFWRINKNFMVLLELISILEPCVSAYEPIKRKARLNHGTTKFWSPNYRAATTKTTQGTTITLPPSTKLGEDQMTLFTLSPEQAIEIAKILVLPLNKTVNLNVRGLKLFGDDKPSVEEMLYDRIVQYIKPNVIKSISKNGTSTIVRENSTGEDPNSLINHLPGASFWKPKNPEVNSSAIAGTPYAQREQPTNPATSNLSSTSKHHPTLQKEIHFGERNMYDYELPTWDGVGIPNMPGMEPDTVPNTTPVPSTTFDWMLTPRTTNHPVLDEIHSDMTLNKRRYFSEFGLKFCEFIGIKDEKHQMLLAAGAEYVLNKADREDRLIHLETRSKRALEHFVADMNYYAPGAIEGRAATCYTLFRNPTLFKPDMQTIVQLIENLVLIVEGENLLHSLIDLSYFPTNGKKPQMVMQRIFDAIMTTYERLIGDTKLHILQQLIEKAVNDRNLYLRSPNSQRDDGNIFKKNTDKVKRNVKTLKYKNKQMTRGVYLNRPRFRQPHIQGVRRNVC